MGFFADILPIIKKHYVTFVSKQNEVGDIVTFHFSFKENVTWKPGQHGLFAVHHVKINKPSRMFSIASTPSEGIIRISMRISATPSEFKSALLALKPSDTLSMRGPVGNFYLNGSNPALLIAGGIGITPMLSIANNYMDNRDVYPQSVELFYIDSREEYLYRDQLNELSTQSQEDFKIKYLTAPETLHEELKKYVAIHGNSTRYFISGPKPMVLSIKDTLISHGILKKHIKHDPFIGY